ncbi:MAG: ComF family protein [Rhodothermales bacterium]|nr:ComF family protein [Rhodothermales bacterium]
MRNTLVRARRGLISLLYPSVCEHCGARSEDAAPLCWRCLRTLERVQACDTVGLLEPFPRDADGIQVQCLWYFDKDGPLRDVAHALKYQNRPWYGRFLGDALAVTLALDSPASVVTPLPLHPIKRLDRGYNQAAWIAAAVSQRISIPVHENLVLRTRPTHTQTTLNRDDRWQNVQDAFRAASAPGPGHSHAVLVDDIVTTGATALSAAVALRAVGFEHVTIAAVGLARD